MRDKKINEPDFSSMKGAHKYFAQNVLPREVQAGKRIISADTPYAHNRDETFLLVSAGTGVLTVNGVDYRLRPNTLVNLSPFHRYRFRPDPGKVLELAEARMNCGTYVYMIANPYYKLHKLTIPSEPPVLYLNGLMAEIARQAFEGMTRECTRDCADKISMCFCYMTDLFGIIVEETGKQGGKSRAK